MYKNDKENISVRFCSNCLNNKMFGFLCSWVPVSTVLQGRTENEKKEIQMENERHLIFWTEYLFHFFIAFLLFSQNPSELFPECYSSKASPRYFVRRDIKADAVWRQVAHNTIRRAWARTVMYIAASHGVFRKWETYTRLVLHAALSTRYQIQTRQSSRSWRKCRFLLKPLQVCLWRYFEILLG